jgi:hypothetical protein
MRCHTIAIAALVPRQRSRVSGDIRSVTAYERPWVRTDAVLVDGTGELVLRFHGRSGIPGIVAGSRLTAEGTPSFERGVFLMRNPLYSLAAPE